MYLISPHLRTLLSSPDPLYTSLSPDVCSSSPFPPPPTSLCTHLCLQTFVLLFQDVEVDLQVLSLAALYGQLRLAVLQRLLQLEQLRLPGVEWQLLELRGLGPGQVTQVVAASVEPKNWSCATALTENERLKAAVRDSDLCGCVPCYTCIQFVDSTQEALWLISRC